jgi:14-3-3 protein epsilon
MRDKTSTEAFLVFHITFHFTNDIMTEDVKDLASIAELLIKISRYKEAIGYIERLIELKPTLAQSECRLFELAFKSAIDPIRRSMQSLVTFYNAEIEEGHMAKAEMIDRHRTLAREELKELCHRAINLIRTFLLPNSQDSKLKVFLYKGLGDYLRYLGEFESGQAFASDVEESYRKAIEIGDNDLMKSDPMRLGVILNYAVFKFEHLKKVTEAVEMLQKARRDAEIDLPDLTPAEQAASLDVLAAMRTNLVVWFDDDETPSQI